MHRETITAYRWFQSKFVMHDTYCGRPLFIYNAFNFGVSYQRQLIPKNEQIVIFICQCIVHVHTHPPGFMNACIEYIALAPTQYPNIRVLIGLQTQTKHNICFIETCPTAILIFAN